MAPRGKRRVDPMDLKESPSLKSWGERPADIKRTNVVIECGWGRLLFGHTFERNQLIADELAKEKEGARDIAFYIRDPQVVIAKAPQALFIDPSVTYRLLLKNYKSRHKPPPAVEIGEIDVRKDLAAVNRIYRARHMVLVRESFIRKTYKGRFIKYWVARDKREGTVLAVAMSIDHKKAFDDPENGASVWAVAVDAQAPYPGVGLALMDHIVSYLKKQGRAFVDVSVMHDNEAAIALYEKMGFTQVPVFCIKNRNAINEALFSPARPAKGWNIYAQIIINEALRRGIKVDAIDPGEGYFRLTHGGRSVVCRESLTGLTSAIAMSRCMDKRTTHKTLKAAGLKVPHQQLAASDKKNREFLKKYGPLAVKPAFGEQGRGISVDVSKPKELKQAVEEAGQIDPRVVLEQMRDGQDLRIIVIDGEVVAAAVRKPPVIIGDGNSTIETLVKKLSRRREKATEGESRIPIDRQLRRTVRRAGYNLASVLKKGEQLTVRKTANLHTGGTIHDVTPELHPRLAEAAVAAADALGIPVVGLDFMVDSPAKPRHVIIEANERPGLANHEPQPTAEKFIDFLFPQTREQRDGETA